MQVWSSSGPMSVQLHTLPSLSLRQSPPRAGEGSRARRRNADDVARAHKAILYILGFFLSGRDCRLLAFFGSFLLISGLRPFLCSLLIFMLSFFPRKRRRANGLLTRVALGGDKEIHYTEKCVIVVYVYTLFF